MSKHLLCILTIIMATVMLIGCGGGGSNPSGYSKEPCIYLDNEVTASMLYGTWVESRASHPENYSNLVKVNPSIYKKYIETITFYSDQTVETVTCSKSITEAPLLNTRIIPTRSSKVNGEWYCNVEKPDRTKEKWHVDGNRLYVSDLSGKSVANGHIECDGKTLYLIAEDNSVSEFKKQSVTNAKMTREFLLNKNWYAVRGPSSGDKTKEVLIDTIIIYIFNNDGTISRKTNLTTDENVGSWSLEDGILHCIINSPILSSASWKVEGSTIGNEIMMDYVDTNDYTILSTTRNK